MHQVDSFFTKGVSHKVCEDYTMHGDVNGKSFAIVCDGCSGSTDTDFGARLLARSAREAFITLDYKGYFKEITDHKTRIGILQDEIKRNLSAMVRATHSDLSVADATLMMALPIDEQMYVFVRGDGTYAYREKDSGNLVIVEIEFESGAPYYFTYDLHPLNQRLYHEQANMNRVVNTYVYDSDGYLQDTSEVKLAYDSMYYEVFNSDAIDFVSIMSDGVSAFQYSGKYMGQKVCGATDTTSIVKQIVAYKNHNGEFVQRRMNRVMRDITKKGLENFDDVSVATIWMGE